MPKNLTSAMREHLDDKATRLAAIWRITRTDGAQFFFTDHDLDIVFGGEIYRADASFERTAIRSDAGFAVDNLDLVGVFAEGGIVEDEVRAGLFDGAGIRSRSCTGRTAMASEIRLRRGTLGETRLTAEHLGIAQHQGRGGAGTHPRGAYAVNCPTKTGQGIAAPVNGHADEFRTAHVQRSDGWMETIWNDPGGVRRGRKRRAGGRQAAAARWAWSSA